MKASGIRITNNLEVLEKLEKRIKELKEDKEKIEKEIKEEDIHPTPESTPFYGPWWSY